MDSRVHLYSQNSFFSCEKNDDHFLCTAFALFFLLILTPSLLLLFLSHATGDYHGQGSKTAFGGYKGQQWKA